MLKPLLQGEQSRLLTGSVFLDLGLRNLFFLHHGLRALASATTPLPPDLLWLSSFFPLLSAFSPSRVDKHVIDVLFIALLLFLLFLCPFLLENAQLLLQTPSLILLLSLLGPLRHAFSEPTLLIEILAVEA